MMEKRKGVVILLLALAAGTWHGQADAASELLLTEVYYDTPGTDIEEEWVEIANISGIAIDLTEYKMGDEESRGGREGMVSFPTGTFLGPGQVMVIAQRATGFRALFGTNPDLEITESDAAVPNMTAYSEWASGEVALANDGDQVLLLDGSDRIVDAMNYGDQATYFSPPVADVFRGQSVERVPADCDTDTAADWRPRSTPTPGEIFLDGECAEPAAEGESVSALTIGDVQGNGKVSPYVNQLVTFRGVVTGEREDRNAGGVVFYTLFVQDDVGREDGDEATSDGIALFLGRERPNYVRGDVVSVRGQVTEFFGLTEIDDEELVLTYEGLAESLPEVTALSIPSEPDAREAYLESLEGMWVTVEGEATVVGPTHAACGFALGFVGTDRFIRRSSDDSDGAGILVSNSSDVSCNAFPNVKYGDVVTGATGVLSYEFDRFRIIVQKETMPQVTPSIWPDVSQAVPKGTDLISVANFNLENHFDTIDDTGRQGEPKPTVGEVAAKRRKISYAIGHVLGCPTIIGIQEVEKASLLHDLAAEAAGMCGFTYQVSHLESPDARGIDVALLSDPQRIAINGMRLRQGCTDLDTGIGDETARCGEGLHPLFSRPPLEVELNVDGELWYFFVNHFKSKREGETETAARRLAQAAHINALANEILESDPKASIVVLGDFNDFDESPAVLAMQSGDGRLVNILSRIAESTRYSFIFDGESQLIDGILASPALGGRVAAAEIHHVNADFPNSLRLDVSDRGLPFRSSDHDLPVVWFQSTLRLLPTPTMSASPEATATSVENGPTVTDSPTVEAPSPTAPIATGSGQSSAAESSGEPNEVPAIVWALAAIGGLAAGLILIRRWQR